MNDSDWSEIQHFTKSENWGDIALISKALMTELDAYRGYVNRPIFITCGTQGTHEEQSQHPAGLAVDIVFPGLEPGGILDMWMAALRFKFNGVGIYPKWMYGGRACGGLHLDVREASYKALWIGLPTDNPNVKTGLQYLPATAANFRSIGL